MYDDVTHGYDDVTYVYDTHRRSIRYGKRRRRPCYRKPDCKRMRSNRSDHVFCNKKKKRKKKKKNGSCSGRQKMRSKQE